MEQSENCWIIEKVGMSRRGRKMKGKSRFQTWLIKIYMRAGNNKENNKRDGIVSTRRKALIVLTGTRIEKCKRQQTNQLCCHTRKDDSARTRHEILMTIMMMMMKSMLWMWIWMWMWMWMWQENNVVMSCVRGQTEWKHFSNFLSSISNEML